jgi:hypothetical protein
MGIYDNWDEFVKMAKENAGTGSMDLPPQGTKWDSIVCYLEFCWYFLQFIVLVFLFMVNFYVWLDLLSFVMTKG